MGFRNDYFSNISIEETPIVCLVSFLSRNGDIYKLLSNDAHVKIQHSIATHNNCKSLGWFAKESIDKHYEDLESLIVSGGGPIFGSSLLSICDTDEWEQKYCHLASMYYGKSRNYDEANIRFGNSIAPHLHVFRIDELTYLISKIESNSQTYERLRPPLITSK